MKIRENIEKAREVRQSEVGTPNENNIILLAATKTRTPEEINYLAECGVTYIGENRVQELLDKYDALDRDKFKLHFIGALQTNKVKYIIDKVDMIESVDRIELAAEIDRRAKQKNLVMDILAEVNIGGEESKSGVRPEDAEEFVTNLTKFTSIRVCGLMTIPPVCEDINIQKQYFKKIIQIFIDISVKNKDNVNMRYASFGMTGDYAAAVECGSNIVRIGTGIFGKREYK